jgi:hypothetical protein
MVTPARGTCQYVRITTLAIHSWIGRWMEVGELGLILEKASVAMTQLGYRLVGLLDSGKLFSRDQHELLRQPTRQEFVRLALG